jgi:hypothetical protein
VRFRAHSLLSTAWSGRARLAASSIAALFGAFAVGGVFRFYRVGRLNLNHDEGDVKYARIGG